MRARSVPAIVLMALTTVAPCARTAESSNGKPWPRRIIDNNSRGADGVRLLDVNNDGLLDIATGWEQGGEIRAYLNPGPSKARGLWPATTVGQVRSPEDAVFADLDGDGAVDVVSSCEGQEQTIFVHWAPRQATNYRNPDRWKTEPIPASAKRMQWMFTVPLQVDGKNGIDLVSGGKNAGAKIGWFASPADARSLDEWVWHPIYDAGWIMSIVPVDMDSDGDKDLLVSDRRGTNSGTLWLENPGLGEAQKRYWKEHRIGATGREVMFLTVADFDRDGLDDVLTAVREKEIVFHRRKGRDGKHWEDHVIRIPESVGTSKSVAVADVDRDGKLDLIFSCERAEGDKSGLMWLSSEKGGSDMWTAHEISGSEGIKYDLIELLDLDGDGDLDVLTCEEADNLGVVWYENPNRRSARPGRR